MSDWSNASKVLQVIRAGDDLELRRGANRTKVLNSANGMPPLSEDDARLLGVKINVNWLELLILLWHARSQLESAFLRNRFFFTVKIPSAPIDYRSEWEARITEEINRPLTKSREYFELHRSRWSSVVTHGVGPMEWPDREKWLPRFVSMADLRIPTDTTTDFRNLTWFAIRRSYSPLELIKEVFNDKKNNKWDKKAVGQILANYKDQNYTDALNNYDLNSPEKLAELVKQNGALWGSDAVPAIVLWHFYYQEEDGDNQWSGYVVPDSPPTRGGDSQEFLWSDTKLASSWQELIHVQFGDLSTDAPFKYHSVRGLGFLLLEPTFYANLTRCRFLQHVMDNFNVWLRVNDNPEKARAQVQEFGNLSVLRNGVQVISKEERHQVDPNNVEFALAQMKQLQGEAAASFTQQTDNGTAKEQTAFEVRVKMEQVNSMMSGILLTAFKFESYAYQEICRRFCIPDSKDKDVKKFRKRMIKAGIPEDYLDVDLWDVDPVAPLGNGNPTIALAMANQLMEIRPMLEADAQQQVLHDYILTVTKDPARATQLAPLDKKQVGEGKRESTGLFAALWTGVAIPLWGTKLIDQIDQIMPMWAGKITQITQRNNMATQDEAMALMNVGNYLQQAIQSLSQDRQQAQRVKYYQDTWGKLNNEAKGVIQRGQQAMKAQAKAQQDQANQAELMMAQAKIQAEQASMQARLQMDQQKAQQKAELDQRAADQKLEIEAQKFQSEQQMAQAKTANEIALSQARTASDVELNREKTKADVANSRLKAKATPTKKGE